MQPRPNRPPPPKRPANVPAVAARTKPQPSLRTPDDTRTSSPSPKLKPKPKAKSENLQNAVLMAKRGKVQSYGNGYDDSGSGNSNIVNDDDKHNNNNNNSNNNNKVNITHIYQALCTFVKNG